MNSNLLYKTYIIADVYSSGTYGSGEYSCSATDRTTCGTAGSTGSGSLTNTGIEIGIVLTFTCLIVFVAILVRFWRRQPKTVPQEAATGDKQRGNSSRAQ